MKLRFFNTQVPLIQKGRRYPIQKDEEGRSLRRRCFMLFKQGRDAREAAEFLGMKLATARRYHSEWNRCPPTLEAIYKYLKKELKTKGELSPNILIMLSTALGIPEWQVINILSQPNGLKSLIMGKFVAMRKQQKYSSQEQRLEAALHLVVLLEQYEMPREWINREIQKLIQKAIRYAKSKNSLDSNQVFDESA